MDLFGICSLEDMPLAEYMENIQTSVARGWVELVNCESVANKDC